MNFLKAALNCCVTLGSVRLCDCHKMSCPRCDSEPDGPMFIYDGGDTALLFRDWGSNIRLNGISSETTSELLNAKIIYVVEMSEDDIARGYAAPVRIVRDVKSLMA